MDFGVRAFLEEIETAVPDAETKSLSYLKQLAKEQEWGESDYFLEEAEIRSKFKDWLPRLVAYSGITLVHSVVETQLLATANRLRELHGHPLKVNDLRGDSVERAKIYLTKVARVHVGSDRGWQTMQDVVLLRNMIVHRRGRQGTDLKDQKQIQQVMARYSGEISLSGAADDAEAELQVSLPLCKRFVDETESFFTRLFEAAGLPCTVVLEQ